LLLDLSWRQLASLLAMIGTTNLVRLEARDPAFAQGKIGFLSDLPTRFGAVRVTATPEAARSMAEACRIRDGDLLVGSSLGGMVACEITKIRKIPQLFLIGSAVRKEEVNALLAALHPLAKYAPVEWVRVSAGKIPLELSQMFTGIESSFVKAMCAAIFKWEGQASPETRVHRLHGKRDLVIPPPPKADLLLEGGHLISMTHAEQCSSYVGTETTRNVSRQL
jgi:hypothetical protein